LTPHVTLVLAQDGTARLLDMGGGFYALSAIGAQMLQETLEQGSDAAVRELAQRYQVSPSRVRADLGALLQQLSRQGLLRNEQQGSCDAKLWLAQILVPCLFVTRYLSCGRTRVALMLTFAKLALLCFGWGRTVTVWQRCLRRFVPRDRAPLDEHKVRSLDQAIRRMAAGHPFPMACKERALSCWALLHWAGVPATLVVGLEIFPLMGHCWCEAGQWIISDYDDNCDLYFPVRRYESLPEMLRRNKD
jgi:hypothetical protein